MFHLGIAQASGNPYFATAMKALEDHIAVGMRFHGMSLRGTQDGLQHVFREHTAIYEAIREGDAEGARRLMREHLERSRNRLFSSS
jgi:GntR family transcriptional repressor for pyruvate dehydrogenase complex